MTEKELTPILSKYGLLPDSTWVVSRPALTKEDRRLVGRLKRRYRDELTAAKIMRTDALNLTRHVDRRKIVASLLEDGHHAPALLLTFTDEQLVLLWAWRDAAGHGSSPQPTAAPDQ